MTSAIGLSLNTDLIQDPRKAIELGLDDAAEKSVKDGDKHQRTWSDKSRSKPDVTKRRGSRRIEWKGKIFRFVDHGTRPRIIRPKNKKVLAFKSKYKRKTVRGKIPSRVGGASGDPVFAKEVRHPGTKPSNFSESLFNKRGKDFAGIMQKRIDEIVE